MAYTIVWVDTDGYLDYLTGKLTDACSMKNNDQTIQLIIPCHEVKHFLEGIGDSKKYLKIQAENILEDEDKSKSQLMTVFNRVEERMTNRENII